MRPSIASVLLSLLPVMAAANEYEPIRDKTEFMSAVGGKELRIGLYNLSLMVMPDGRIEGSALGWKITGDWSWDNGYFCRELDWSGKEIAYNCQLVEKRGEREMRFTSDEGQGQSATFRLR